MVAKGENTIFKVLYARSLKLHAGVQNLICLNHLYSYHHPRYRAQNEGVDGRPPLKVIFYKNRRRRRGRGLRWWHRRVGPASPRTRSRWSRQMSLQRARTASVVSSTVAAYIPTRRFYTCASRSRFPRAIPRRPRRLRSCAFVAYVSKTHLERPPPLQFLPRRWLPSLDRGDARAAARSPLWCTQCRARVRISRSVSLTRVTRGARARSFGTLRRAALIADARRRVDASRRTGTSTPPSASPAGPSRVREPCVLLHGFQHLSSRPPRRTERRGCGGTGPPGTLPTRMTTTTKTRRCSCRWRLLRY